MQIRIKIVLTNTSYDIFAAYCNAAQNGFNYVRIYIDVQAQFNAKLLSKP